MDLRGLVTMQSELAVQCLQSRIAGDLDDSPWEGAGLAQGGLKLNPLQRQTGIAYTNDPRFGCQVTPHSSCHFDLGVAIAASADNQIRSSTDFQRPVEPNASADFNDRPPWPIR